MDVQNIKNAILDYDPETVVINCKKAIESGIDPHEIIKGGFTEALISVGAKFENGDLFLVHLISAAHAAEKGLKYFFRARALLIRVT